MGPGEVFAGRYQIVALLGSGATGAVYRATDTRLQRDVAIKLLTSAAATVPERFVREARTIASLTHPNIVNIFDIGESNGRLFLAQELLVGRTLSEVLAGAVEIPGPAVIEILLQIAGALQYAHARGVVHRDVKPGNIFLLESGDAKLLDFGIAKLTEASNLTVVDAGLVGTPAYAAPEQLRGGAIDGRTDIFSLGAVAFEMISGRKPFEGTTVYEVVSRRMTGATPRLRDVMPGCPEDLDDLVARCMASRPDDRPASMEEVRSELRKVQWVGSLTSPGEQIRVLAGGPETFAVAPAPIPPPGSLNPLDPFVATRDSLRGTPFEPNVNPLIPSDYDPLGTDGLMDGAVPAPPVPSPRSPAPPVSDRHFGAPASPEGTMLGPVINPELPPAAGTPRTDSYSPRGPLTERAGVLPAGTRVGRFTLHEVVAQGQTGHLYKAFDPVRSRLVGVKVIQDRSSVAVTRLLRAARIWLDLRHPNLQTILDVDPGSDSTPAFVVTQLIEGLNLRRLLERRRLDLLQKIEVALQVCDALDYMHSRGVIHREIKPGNIILAPADLRVTLLDSGLARSVEANEQLLLTSVGAPVGNLRYMAPEQAHGTSDQRSDIYSLGVVLYEMCMEETFDAGRRAEMLERLAAAEHLPRPLVITMTRALKEQRQHRFSTVRELADGLRSLVPEKLAPLNLSQVVVTLHGIRTHARWQRACSEVSARAGLHCKLDRWNFGYFSVFRLIAPWSRESKVTWFRTTYHDEFGERATSPLSTERPSVIAHSFGTYILGHALLRYPYLRFNKVLLCGSILPEDFPWDVLIDRGQVQAVRNEYGARDFWTRTARSFVPGTGTSGLRGFSRPHERLEQERFDFSHSEYFERGHMEEKWLPFIKRRVSFITPRERDVDLPSGERPMGLYVLYAGTLAAVAAAIAWVL